MITNRDDQLPRMAQSAVLELQATNLRDLIQERRKAQATMIAIEYFVTHDLYIARLHNYSSQSIYDIAVSFEGWGLILADHPIGKPVVPVIRSDADADPQTPRWAHSRKAASDKDLVTAQSMVTAWFRDASGHDWQINTRGEMHELTPNEAMERYDLQTHGRDFRRRGAVFDPDAE